MLLQRAMIVWVMAAAALPVTAAYGVESAPDAPAPASESSPPNEAPASPVRTEGIQFDARPAGLVYKVGAPASTLRPDDFRFDFAQRPASDNALRLFSARSALRPGWALSGRAGPLRWLTPIDGEGQTKMRFGGRLPDQPRTPGLGLFNMSLHYAFE